MVVHICRSFPIDSAHHLPNYDGKCRYVHGHRWTLEVEVSGEIEEDGMVLDFAVLKSVVQTCVIDKLDHNDINNVISNPTAENILTWIREALEPRFITIRAEGRPHVRLERLKLWENPESFAEIKKGFSGRWDGR